MLNERAVEQIHARVGTTVSEKYRLERLIGLGAMAAVYAATHRNGGRFAIKLLHPSLSRANDVRTRFLREAYVANKISHAGVVRIVDDDTAADGCVYLVMELLEGKTLEIHRQDSGMKLVPGEAVRIASDVLDVLAAAHAERVIHRDIQPDNIFLTNDGATKLMDFGIARLLDLTGMTASGARMGTPGFMPPEQARGINREIDARSDVWSTGALLFFLLSGEEVHVARTSAEQMIVAAVTPARSITAVLPELPADLAAVVDTALAFDPDHRFQGASAMRTALGHAGASLPVPAARAPVAGADAPAARPVFSGTTTLVHGSGSGAGGRGARGNEDGSR